jgi:hypothetical protein
LLDLKSFEQFYVEALSRDRAMTNNLLRAMDENKTNVAVIVTGGFHTQGMMAQLNKQGITTITYAPKVSKVEDENGTSYLSVFTQEKTPLDKLFAGEKLFVNPPPMVDLKPIVPTADAHHLAITTHQDHASVKSGGISYSVKINLSTQEILRAAAEVPFRLLNSIRKA